MDHKAYVTKLRARIAHLDVELDRARDLRADHPIRHPLEALRQHAAKIESETEKWEHHREAVEGTLGQVQDEIEADEGTLAQMAESVRDGAVELFRGEPSELVRRTEAVMARLKKK